MDCIITNNYLNLNYLKVNKIYTNTSTNNHIFYDYNTKSDLNSKSSPFLDGEQQDRKVIERKEKTTGFLPHIIKGFSLKLNILVTAILLFTSTFVFAGVGDKVTVTGGASTAAGANGDYFYAGTTNVDGTLRDYYDMPSSTYRIEYRNNPSYGNEWEVWESTARGGGGTVRFFKASSAATIPTGTWTLDVGSGTGVITFTAAPVASTVTTQAVSSISTTTATGNGNITSLGSPNPTVSGICWNTSTSPTTSNFKTTDGPTGVTGAYTGSLTSLSANTTYYVRAYATNTAGTSYGTEVSFTTSGIAPTVTTQAVNSILATTATGNGNITSLGVPNPSAYGVCWSTTLGAETATGSHASNGSASATGAFTASMTGLTANTTYYVKAYATNTAGTVYGSEVSFTTLTNGTFTAATNNDWATASNWASNSVPTSATDVTIPSGKTVIISPTATAACNNLTVSGTLTIQSSASGTGSLIVNGASTGTVNCERYMTGSAWHWVSPLTVGGSVNTFIQAPGNAVALSGSNYGIMDYNETSNVWNPYFTTATTGNFTAGKGYGIRRSSDGVATFTGTLTTGTNTVAITKGGTAGWNLIGNPYTSSIYMNTAANASYNFIATNSSKLDASYACIYLWDVATSTYKILGNTSYSGRDLDINVFAPGQAFFVKAASAGTVEFNKNMQVQQTGATFKAPAVTTSWSGIALKAASADASSSAIITFNEKMTKGLDPTYDAGLLRGTNGLSLYTRLVEDNGVDFAIQCLPENYSNLVIPVGVDCKDGGEITFSAETVELPKNCKVMIEDKTTNTFTSLAEGGTYKTTVSAGSTSAGRFYIHTSGNTTTGTAELTADINSLKAYIANGAIIIEGEIADQGIATLYNLQGLKLHVNPLQKGFLNTLPCSGLMKGIYLLTIQQNGKTATKKLIKE